MGKKEGLELYSYRLRLRGNEFARLERVRGFGQRLPRLPWSIPFERRCRREVVQYAVAYATREVDRR